MAKKKVLIADDDAALVKALEMRCKQLDLEVITCTNGHDARLKAIEQLPDLIILDLNMPATDGLSVCDNLMDNPRLAGVPVVMLTGDTSQHILEQCERVGAHWVSKGIDAWNDLKPLICELIDIPLDSATASTDVSSQSNSTQEKSSTNRPCTILCIDDDPAISKIIQIRLQQYGIKVERAFNGTQGYRTALYVRPHVIITDYRMPDGMGNYLLGRFRTHPITAHIPVIVLTGRTIGGRKDFALERELLTLGATAYLTKPLVIEELLTELRRHINLPKEPATTLAVP